MSRAQRAVPPPGPDQALGRGLADIVRPNFGGVWVRPTGLAMPQGWEQASLYSGPGVVGVSAAAAKPAADEAKRRQDAERATYVAGLEARVEELEDANRGLAIRLDELEAAQALAVAEAVRETEHRILGRERKTVAGHTMPSILADD